MEHILLFLQLVGTFLGLPQWLSSKESACNAGVFFFFFPFIFISWRLIISQHCSGFCHTLTWISHGVTCIPHPDPPSHLPLHAIPLGLPSAPGLSTCLMHPTWAGDLFHYRLYTCFSLKTSHRRLLPQSPRVCSVHLCLFFCFLYIVLSLPSF